jgi:hypothetical protein
MLLYFCHSSRNQLCSKWKKPFVVGYWRNNLIFRTRCCPAGVWGKPPGDPANDMAVLPWVVIKS